ncbi:hypothetical protein I0P11_07570 [Acinetobacter baumannii]|uniref:hypothetical protein n=1 Tax=Acinetobacter baumannii TaxID=470 RepID=UPI0018B0086C|nr:hypothetical protein [Acinetobacter baumannii]MBF9260997.1 hypothetical protein [Acinetobacter baumannii]
MFKKELLISLFLAFMYFLITLMITKDWAYSKAVFLIGASYHFLSTRIFELKQDIKALKENNHG